MRNEALEEAIGIAGGQLALADKIGVSQSLVSYWLKKSKKGSLRDSC
jgi:DNA-binding transcriptional regulator YdaS (Cro superfamily)